MHKFKKVTFNDIKEHLINYTKELRLVDTYWEWYIIDADLYEILIDDDLVGFFSIHKEENMLTSFHMNPTLPSKSIFENIIEEFSVNCAYVVTNDELMLSLCMDKHVRIELQAYFFDDSQLEVADAEFSATMLKLAEEKDLKELEEIDFFHPLAIHDGENLIYVMRNEQDEFMGAGHIQRMQLERKWGAVGMYVSPDFRQMGVGRSIILHLKGIVKQMELIPIAGCWYYNHNSSKTLECCGFSSKTRLLKVYF
ncbi:MAG: GNAT family N-acetyltransferase [Oscillospiraceae bacterium]